MANKYKYLDQRNEVVERLSDGLRFYPKDNPEFMEWAAVGNTPDPADQVDLAPTARAQRDNLIAAVAWRYERYARELRLGLQPTDDIEAMDIYVQKLADLTKQVGFPDSITWPVAP